MHVLAGLDTAESGTVQLATDAGLVELMQLDERRLTRVRREHVGFIFQAFNLVPAMTARENILLPSTLGGPAPEKGALERIAEELGLADRLGHRPHELSGGSSSGWRWPGRWSPGLR